MTDSAAEALRRALEFHSSLYAKQAIGWPSKDPKKYTPQDIAKTAEVFRKFLER